MQETNRRLRTSRPPRAKGDARPSPSTQPPGAARPNTADDVEKLFVTIFRYRHLLANLDSEIRKRNREERQRAPKVRGERPAAVLARLWADDDLGLAPTSQKRVGMDLGLDASQISDILGSLEKPGTSGGGCVKLVSDPEGPVNEYKITDAGKQELESWLLVHYAPGPFIEFVKKMDPDPKKVADLLDDLKKKVKDEVGR